MAEEKSSGSSLALRNVFVALQPSEPIADLSYVNAALSKLGLWARVLPTFWYLKTPANAQQVGARLKRALPEGSQVLVVDVTGGETSWGNIHKDVERFFVRNWDR